jgi:hypothetical protein
VRGGFDETRVRLVFSMSLLIGSPAFVFRGLYGFVPEHPVTSRYIPSHEGTRITIIYGEELDRRNSSPKKTQIGLSTHDFCNDGFGIRVDFAKRFISSLADFKAAFSAQLRTAFTDGFRSRVWH